MREFRSPDGALLFTQADLDRALAARRARTARRLMPAWMHSLRWPAGMVAALRHAHRSGDRRALARLLDEGRMLARAEAAGFEAAAAAIRHQLRRRYTGFADTVPPGLPPDAPPDRFRRLPAEEDRCAGSC